MNRRAFLKTTGAASVTAPAFSLSGCTDAPSSEAASVSPETSEEMYQKALNIAKTKVRGGPDSWVGARAP